MKVLTVRERISRLPFWMQNILVQDVHEALKNRLEVLEREALKEQCGIYERRKFLEENEESLQRVGINIRSLR